MENHCILFVQKLNFVEQMNTYFSISDLSTLYHCILELLSVFLNINTTTCNFTERTTFYKRDTLPEYDI